MNQRVLGYVLLGCGVVTAQTPEDAQREKLRAGTALLQRGQIDEAIRELRAGVAMNPNAAEAHIVLGQAYLAKQSAAMFAEAQAEFRQALELDPRQAFARFFLAKMYLDLGRYEKARQQLLAALETKPDVPLMLGLLGEVERKLGRPEASIELNRKGLQLDPSMTPLHYHVALALLDLKKDDEALQELQSAVQSKYVSIEMFVTLSGVYKTAGKYAEAENAARKAIAMDVTRPEGHLALAQLYNARGASEKALDEVRLALPEGRGLLSSPYYQQLRADVYFEQGTAYQAKRSVAAAIEAFEKSLEHDPERAEARRRLEELRARKK